jgi:predicted TIM-barrel fold metal-dependent hydrolase
LWKLANGWYPGLDGSSRGAATDDHGVGDYTKISGRDYLLEHYLADAKSINVVKLVHVTAAQAAPSFPDETRWLQALSDNSGIAIAIVGKTHLTRPIREIEAELAEHARSPNFRGIRNEEGIVFGSRETYAAFEVMQRMGLLYDVVAHEDQLMEAATLASRFPGMPFVLEHTGWPRSADRRTYQAWCDGIRAFAAQPNTVCKISGLGMVMHRWKTADFAPWVLHALEAFGSDRCMFATNFPVDSLYSSYERLLEAFGELTHGLSTEERDAVFAVNAERVHQI